MAKDTLKFAITGHIDHGKSTLIGRLLLDTKSLPPDQLKQIKKISKEYGKDTELAYLSDQLKEEREKNITIETTEIFLKTPKRDYCIIDTPGHLEFIKNMLTGTSHASAALIMVDANEGVQDQTRRHAYLIRLLEIKNVIVLINKMDAVNYDQSRFDKVRDNVTSLFVQLGLSSHSIIPVSAKAGDNIIKKSPNMPWYKGLPLIKILESIKIEEQKETGPLRFPIQDVYKIDKEEIAVGKIVSGYLKKGQTITLFPSKKKAKIDKIKIFQQNKSRATTNESVGLTFDPALDLKRGDIVCDSMQNVPITKRFKGNIFWMSEKPLAKGDKVTLRCATQELTCKINTIERRFDPSSLETSDENAENIKHNEAGIIHFEILGDGLMENFHDIDELGRYTIERDEVLQGAGTVLEVSSKLL